MWAGSYFSLGNLVVSRSLHDNSLDNICGRDMGLPPNCVSTDRRLAGHCRQLASNDGKLISMLE